MPDLEASPSSEREYQVRPRYTKRRRSDYSPQDASNSNEDLSYLKTAPTEASVERPQRPRQPDEPYSRIYSYNEQQQFRKAAYRDDYEQGEQASASTDNELAQLAAAVSSLSPTASPEMFSADFSQLYSRPYASIAAANSPIPVAVPPFNFAQASAPQTFGVPAGAIVGAPGSQPPPGKRPRSTFPTNTPMSPGMKLAGYVTMAAPQPVLPMVPRTPYMAPSNTFPGYLPAPPMPQYYNNQGNQAPQPTTQAPARSFLSRLNPMNLFRSNRTTSGDLRGSESRRRPFFVRRIGRAE